jgi:hypothetical protein
MVAESVAQIPECSGGNVDAKVCGVGIADGDLKDEFTAAVELAEEFLAVEQPRVGKFSRWSVMHDVMLSNIQPLPNRLAEKGPLRGRFEPRRLHG